METRKRRKQCANLAPQAAIVSRTSKSRCDLLLCSSRRSLRCQLFGPVITVTLRYLINGLHVRLIKIWFLYWHKFKSSCNVIIKRRKNVTKTIREPES